MEFLIVIQLIILDIIIVAYGGLFFYILLNKFIPTKQHDVPHLEDNHDYINETLYDDGYVTDMEAFDDRISNIKENLDMQYSKIPAVEIITEEYERNTQNF